MKISLKEELLSEVEAAEIIQYSPKTLKKNRCIGRNHPPFVKLGRKTFYPREKLLSWIKNRELHEALS